MKITKVEWYTKPKEMSYMLGESHIIVINALVGEYILCRCNSFGNTCGGLFSIKIEGEFDRSKKPVNEEYLRKLIGMIE